MKQKFLLIILSISVLSGCGSCKVARQNEKVIFHTSRCFGFCPTYHLEVNADRHLRLHIESVYKPQSTEVDSAKIGYYEGTLEKELFDELNRELDAVHWDKLRLENTNCCDGVLKTIIFYREGRREVVREMFPPKELEALIAVLYKICETEGLRKTAPFQLESVPNPNP